MKEFEFTERIMGTSLSIALVTENEAQATLLFNDSHARLSAYETQFSRFIPTSELSILNKMRSHTVSPLFISILNDAKKLYLETDGYFNPLLQIERFGYTSTYESVKESSHGKNSEPYNIDLNCVDINTETNVVTLVSDQKLDFGGFLKGYLAEYEATYIHNNNPDVHGVIVNIGGDIHTRGVDEYGDSFIFEIENPIRGDTISVPMRNTSLATSGTYGRTWVAGNEHMHHILARDGTHNTDKNIVSTSVIHKHGGTAEAYAKALFSLSPEMLEQKNNQKLQYIIITQDGNVHSSL